MEPLKRDEIFRILEKIAFEGGKTDFEWESEICPRCGSNQYRSDTDYCYTCSENK